jgi:hypothetical protein
MRINNLKLQILKLDSAASRLYRQGKFEEAAKLIKQAAPKRKKLRFLLDNSNLGEKNV